MGRSAIHVWAAEAHTTGCLDVLLEHGIELNLETFRGWTPFQVAVLNGNTFAAEALRAVMSAAQFQEALEVKKTNHTHLPFTLLGHVIKNGGMTRAGTLGLKYLLQLLPRSFKSTFIVAPSNHFTAIHTAVDGLDFNQGVFQDAARLPALRVLISEFSSPEHLNAETADGATALHLAVWLGKYEELRLLVEAGADVNVTGVRDSTPLDQTFWDPPKYFVEDKLPPTKEMVKRFLQARNGIPRHLRRKGAKHAWELRSGGKLEDRVPFPEGGEAGATFRRNVLRNLTRAWEEKQKGVEASV